MQKLRQTLGIYTALIFNLYIIFLKKYFKSLMISSLSLHLAADPLGNPTKLFSNLIMNEVLMIGQIIWSCWNSPFQLFLYCCINLQSIVQTKRAKFLLTLSPVSQVDGVLNASEQTGRNLGLANFPFI